jgi:hypothetical protein
MSEGYYYLDTVDFVDKKCPKCADPVRKHLVSVSRNAPSTYPSGEIWQRDDVFALLPRELILVTCFCGYRAFTVPSDATPRVVEFTLTDDGQLINRQTEGWER